VRCVGIRVSMDCWRLECGWIIVRVRGCAYSLTVSRRHIFTQKRKVDFYVNLSRIIMFFIFIITQSIFVVLWITHVLAN
jgi:hypothetical protein